MDEDDEEAGPIDPEELQVQSSTEPMEHDEAVGYMIGDLEDGLIR